jgi:hypothetical protein
VNRLRVGSVVGRCPSKISMKWLSGRALVSGLEASARKEFLGAEKV